MCFMTICYRSTKPNLLCVHAVPFHHHASMHSVHFVPVYASKLFSYCLHNILTATHLAG